MARRREKWRRRSRKDEEKEDDNGDQARVGLVRNSHIDRTLRMEGGEAFRIIVVEQARASPGFTYLPSSLVIPFTFSAGDPLPPFPSPRFARSGPDDIGRRAKQCSRQDYPVYNARQLAPRSSLHYRETFPVALSSLASSPRFLRRENGFFARSSK